MSGLDRRTFLKRSVIATGAITALPNLSKLPLMRDEQATPVITRTLGRTGITLPVVSFGVMRADNPALVRDALKAGIVHLDTAHGYQKGKNEEMLGTLLREYPRTSFVISTKIPSESTKEAFLAKLEISLQRLQMKQVDILYMHGVNDRQGVLQDVMLEAMAEAKKTGKTRFIGVSTHRSEPEVIRAAVEAKIYDVVLTSINYRQDHVDELAKAIAEAAHAGVGIVAMKTMAGGFLDRERTKPVNCKAALKWVLQNENVTTAIPGVTTFEQLAENVSVNRTIVLTEQEKKDLALAPSQGGLYCDGCGHCDDGCPKHLPIPELMRAFMYTYGYGTPRMGHEVVSSVRLSANPCGECTVCTSSCTKGFDIRDRIADVVRLRDVPVEFLA